MKNKILLMLLTCPALLFAQGKYIIKGKAGFNTPAKVYLYNIGERRITDSASVKEGLFEFNGQVNEVTLALLLMDEKGTGQQNIDYNNPAQLLPFFLEQGTIMVWGGDSLATAKLSGTKANEDYMLYKAAKKPVIDAIKQLGITYNAKTPEERNSQAFLNYIAKQQSAIQQQADSINDRFIIAHPDANISLQTLVDALNADRSPDAANLQAQFSKLSKKLKESQLGVFVKDGLDKLQMVAVGSIAPDFIQPDTNGAPVKLSAFRGKYLLLDFWASWCGPCRNENPNLVKAYSIFKNKNFTILSVSLDKPGKKEDWLKAIHADGLRWTHVSDLKFGNNEAALLYNVKSIPQNLLIDPDGKIIARNIFGEVLQKKLTQVLNITM